MIWPLGGGVRLYVCGIGPLIGVTNMKNFRIQSVLSGYAAYMGVKDITTWLEHFGDFRVVYDTMDHPEEPSDMMMVRVGELGETREAMLVAHMKDALVVTLIVMRPDGTYIVD
jgi:hypothetical protein